MEFSYTISESDYVRASKLTQRFRKSSVRKTVIFWAFIVICLTLLFAVVKKQTSQTDAQATEETQAAEPAAQPTPVLTAMLVQVAPLAGVLVVLGGLCFVWIPYLRRKMYRKDRNVQGAITVALDTESFQITTSLGTQARSPWSAFDEWFQKDGLILLRYPNQTSQLLNISGLSEPQREELRGILTAALPKKK